MSWIMRKIERLEWEDLTKGIIAWCVICLTLGLTMTVALIWLIIETIKWISHQ